MMPENIILSMSLSSSSISSLFVNIWLESWTNGHISDTTLNCPFKLDYSSNSSSFYSFYSTSKIFLTFDETKDIMDDTLIVLWNRWVRNIEESSYHINYLSIQSSRLAFYRLVWLLRHVEYLESSITSIIYYELPYINNWLISYILQI